MLVSSVMIVACGGEASMVCDPINDILFFGARKNFVRPLPAFGPGGFTLPKPGFGANIVWLPWHANRSALLLSDGVIYVGFGSQCEGKSNPKYKRYNGWLLAYDARTLRQVGSFNTTPRHGVR